MVPFPLTFAEALEEKEARGIAVGEARGEARAMRESILLLLERRFGAASVSLRDKLMAISDLVRLREILARAVEISSVDQLEAALS